MIVVNAFWASDLGNASQQSEKMPKILYTIY